MVVTVPQADAGPSYPSSSAASAINLVLPNLLSLEKTAPVSDSVTGSTSLPPLQNIAALAAGGYHTCALTTAGGANCWGYDEYGQLGDGTTTHNSTPVAVVGLSSGVAALAAGGWHTCALVLTEGSGLTTSSGGKCWGWDGNGQLGLGTITYRTTPVDVVTPVMKVYLPLVSKS